MSNIFQIRRGTAAEWTAADPILYDGEQGFEIDTKKMKMGDGSTAWTLLGYFIADGNAGANILTDLADVVVTAVADGDILEYDSVSGNWVNGQDVPGRVIQVIEGTIAALTGTTNIPYDSTTPLSTEGTQFGAAPLTMVDAANEVHISFNFVLSASNNNSNTVLAVFRDTVCIGAWPIGNGTSEACRVVNLSLNDIPGGPGPYSYSGRLGINAGTWKVNTPTGGTLGGAVVAGSLFRITEVDH